MSHGRQGPLRTAWFTLSMHIYWGCSVEEDVPLCLLSVRVYLSPLYPCMRSVGRSRAGRASTSQLLRRMMPVGFGGLGWVSVCGREDPRGGVLIFSWRGSVVLVEVTSRLPVKPTGHALEHRDRGKAFSLDRLRTYRREIQRFFRERMKGSYRQTAPDICVYLSLLYCPKDVQLQPKCPCSVSVFVFMFLWSVA